MSDVRKFVKKTADSPAFASAEKAERAEGLRDALRAGHGNAVAGAKKLGYKKEGLPAAEKLAARKMAAKKGKR